jgi:hypothetical protein
MIYNPLCEYLIVECVINKFMCIHVCMSIDHALSQIDESSSYLFRSILILSCSLGHP